MFIAVSPHRTFFWTSELMEFKISIFAWGLYTKPGQEWFVYQ